MTSFGVGSYIVLGALYLLLTTDAPDHLARPEE